MSRHTSTISALVSLVVFILLETVCLVLISRNGVIQKYKLMTAFRSLQTSIWERGGNLRHFISLKDVNRELSEENIRLLEELEQYKHFTSKHISDSLIHTYSPDFTYIPATVIKNNTNRQHNYLIIDKGAEDGVEADMGVITPSGVIGYTQSVGKHHALVVSFLDIDYTITALIKKNGTFGTLSWDGKRVNEALLREIPIHADFAVGDTITTSGYSALYPKGIDIGTVSSSANNGGTSYDLTISLFQDFSSLKHVYVVKNPNNAEFKKLIETGESLL